MVPYARDGDFAVATRIFFNIKEGDVLVFRSPSDGTILIKRVKRLEKDEDGPGLFMEGDNRMRSTDSNRFGTVKREAVIGKVVFIARRGR